MKEKKIQEQYEIETSYVEASSGIEKRVNVILDVDLKNKTMSVLPSFTLTKKEFGFINGSTKSLQKWLAVLSCISKAISIGEKILNK